MPRKPTLLDRQLVEGRTLVYRMMYLGLPLSIFHLTGQFLDWPAYIVNPIGGGLAGLLVSTATGDTDEFLSGELAFASKVLVCALGLLAFAGLLSSVQETPLYDAPVVFGLLSCVFFLALMAKRSRG